MSKIRRRLLHALAQVAVFFALLPLTIQIRSILGTQIFFLSVPQSRPMDLLFLLVGYLVGAGVGLLNTFWLSLPKIQKRFFSTGEGDEDRWQIVWKITCALLDILLASALSVFYGGGIGDILLMGLSLLLASSLGSRNIRLSYYHILTDGWLVVCALATILSGILDAQVTDAQWKYVAWQALLLAYATAMARSQGTLDDTLFVQKRVSVAPPGGIRIRAAILCSVLGLVGAGVLLFRDQIWPVVKQILIWIRDLIFLLIRSVLWLLNRIVTGESSPMPPQGAPEQDLGGLVEETDKGRLAEIIFYILVVGAILFLVIAFGPRVLRALRSSLEKLWNFILSLLKKAPSTQKTRDDFVDTSEMLTQRSERSKKKTRQSVLRLNQLSKLATTTEKLRFLYRYGLQAIGAPRINATPKQILLRQAEQAYESEFAQLTKAYEDCRYGNTIPELSDIHTSEQLVRAIEKKAK